MTKKTDVVKDPFDILEDIKTLGQKQIDVKISDKFTVTLATITAEEEIEVFKNCAELDGTEYLSRLKREILSRSIKSVNGEKLEYVDMEDDDAAREKARMAALKRLNTIMGKWRDDLINYLYQSYLEMNGDVESQLEKLGLIATNEIKDRLNKLSSDLEEETKQAKDDTKE